MKHCFHSRLHPIFGKRARRLLQATLSVDQAHIPQEPMKALSEPVFASIEDRDSWPLLAGYAVFFPPQSRTIRQADVGDFVGMHAVMRRLVEQRLVALLEPRVSRQTRLATVVAGFVKALRAWIRAFEDVLEELQIEGAGAREDHARQGAASLPKQPIDAADLPSEADDDEAAELPSRDVLSRSQAETVRLLVGCWGTRSSPGPQVSAALVPRWSHPLVIGPSGSGKRHAIRRAAAACSLSYYEFDLGAWNLEHRDGTLRAVQRVIRERGATALIHLTGLDGIAPALLNGDQVNLSYRLMQAAEVVQVLGELGSRAESQPFLVVSGRFSSLFGKSAELDRLGESDQWRKADTDALSAEATTAALTRNGLISSAIMSRLMLPPVIVARPDLAEADELASKIHAISKAAGPAFDGLDLPESEVAEILRGEDGWLALTRRFQQRLFGWVGAHAEEEEARTD